MEILVIRESGMSLILYREGIDLNSRLLLQDKDSLCNCKKIKSRWYLVEMT